ncbi:MAG TPA: ABC-F family ATP-binding cassette domain-containing protein [Clostridia bacterium]|nr:ABC-F family ATP-binding cassette domain-containing protein [Clostridia bacterium]
MSILTAESISKSYSEKILFNEISFSINEGEKIGVIGVNGTGKSTLLKVIAGAENADSGEILKVNGLNVEYLPQNPNFDDEATVLQQVFKGNSELMKTLREYTEALQTSQNNTGDSRLEKALVVLTQKMDELGAWSIESEAKSVLTKLGIADFKAKIGTLSGGQRKRVAMASAILSPSGLLVLDEPTNHIDNDTVDWLENYLNNRKGALLMVTHDRYFLDRVADRILELDRGRLFSYQGNYTKYLEMSAEREELEKSSERKRKNLLRKELEWIRRGAQARSTKQKARIDRYDKLKDEEVLAANGSVEIKAASSRLGKTIIEIEHVSKNFPEIELISDFSYVFLRDDRVGVIGSNGAGKSTLLKMIAGRIEPDNGSIKKGETVKIGFFTQENENMKEDIRVIDYIREEAEYIETDEGTLSASMMLERFLFPPAVQWTPISKLSGGEKRRLYLLRILMGSPNILLLDEPTNDLDIQTLTILESYLDEFKGVVVTVSHDRYFLDRVVSKIFAFEGNGVVTRYVGNYSDYCGYIKEAEAEANVKSVEREATSNQEITKVRQLKFSFKEQKEYEQIDGIIAGLEDSIKQIETDIAAAASDFERLPDLLSKKEQMEAQLEEAIERWAYLSELEEKISKSKGIN